MSDDRPLRGCKWPLWPHDARPNHEYCGCKKMPGSSYCYEHYEKSIRSADEPATPFVPRKKAA
jgi:hypothetical protein